MNSVDLHKYQSIPFSDMFIDNKYRYLTLCCSRGWGKSVFGAVAAATAVQELMQLPASVPNKNVFIIAPTFDQVADIYFPMLNYDLGLEDWTERPASRDTGRFIFPNRVSLRLLSYESIERMRGKGRVMPL
jgi:hypothetical protein